MSSATVEQQRSFDTDLVFAHALAGSTPNGSYIEDHLPLMEHARGTMYFEQTSCHRHSISCRNSLKRRCCNHVATNSHGDNLPREHRLNFRRMRLYPHFLLRAIPRQSRAVRREARIMNTEGFRLLQGAPKGRGCTSHATGSRYRCRRSVSGPADVRLATGVCHRNRTTCDETKLMTRLLFILF